jgi:hypothetical protein
LEQVTGYSEELAQMLKREFWTAKDLGRVPEPYLAKVVKTLSNEDRCSLILALPKAESERIRSMVPEGNARSIVFDKVQKAITKNDPVQFQEAARTTRRLLDRLRLEANAGKFQPLGDPAPVVPFPGGNAAGDQQAAA